ncbi:MAG: S9 family peptidase [Acidobacteria bacterium]|nr:S9 family peptidase [Acidobacteriota bacterium]MCI0723227.1 S9 family peptidase [Acidobacteriota bacterium]
MTTLLRVLVGLLMSPCFVSVAASAVGGWTPDLAMKVKRVSHVRVSPDGQRVAFVAAQAVMEPEKSEWLSHIYLAASDGTGSFQLTQGEKPATFPEWSPDGQWLAFLAARGSKPEAKTNLWRIRAAGGEAEQLTDQKSSITALRWSPDGSQIAFCMTDPKTEDEEKASKEKRDWRVVDEDLKPVRLYLVSAEKDASGKRGVRKLTTEKLSVDPVQFDWAPDGRSIVFSHSPTPKADDWTQADISILEVASGKTRVVAGAAAAEDQPAFSPDGRWIAYRASDVPPAWAGASRLQLIAAEGGAPRGLAPSYDGKPNILGWSADGRRLFVSETHRTVSRIWAIPAEGGHIAGWTPENLMVESPSLNASRTHFGFVSQAADQPVEAFVSAVSGFSAAQVSRVQNLPKVALGKTEVIEWKSADGKSIEGLLTYPAGYQAGSRVPLLVLVHGGPAGVFLRTFTGNASPYLVAAFASRGYALLRCNVRGSSGYGRDFRYANRADWGGGDYRDIMSGVDALISKGLADPDRLGVMGWSYGGYMTSWVITQTKRFKAASVGAGVTNLMSFTGTADIPSFVPDYFGGDYWDVFDRWRTHSAMFNVKGVSTPTLIQHGDADLRVPVSQGYEFYNALKRQNVPVKMVVYPRQPHGIQEPKMMLDAMQRNLEWFDRWIKGNEALKEGHYLFTPK